MEILPWLKVEAKERQGERTDITQKIAGSYGEAREQAAKLTGTNRQYVSDARQVQRKYPEKLLDKISV